jgi:hypothetical protein
MASAGCPNLTGEAKALADVWQPAQQQVEVAAIQVPKASISREAPVSTGPPTGSALISIRPPTGNAAAAPLAAESQGEEREPKCDLKECWEKVTWRHAVGSLCVAALVTGIVLACTTDKTAWIVTAFLFVLLFLYLLIAYDRNCNNNCDFGWLGGRNQGHAPYLRPPPFQPQRVNYGAVAPPPGFIM